MSKIVLTGSSGFIGGHLAKVLDCECVPDPFQAYTVRKGIDTLIHLAAITDPQSTDEANMMFVNHYAALTLFQEAIRKGVKRIIYASSASVYGDNKRQIEAAIPNPLTVYAKSKALLEKDAAKLCGSTGHAMCGKVLIMGLRFSNVYGPGEAHKGKSASVVYQLVQQMKRGERPKLFKHGEQERDWVSVHDVCRTIELATWRGWSGVYNVGSGTATSFNDVVKLINEAMGTSLQPEYIDNPYTGYQSYTNLHMRVSSERLGYKPEVSLKDGIAELVKASTPALLG